MNILLTSAGRRTQLVKYFMENYKEVITADCSNVAPGIYIGDKGYTVPRINENNYLDKVVDICNKNSVKGIIPLIDPEISLLAKEKDRLTYNGITPVVPDIEPTEICFDKYRMAEFLDENNFYFARTYESLTDFYKALEKKKIDFPVFIKPRKGSASIGINQVDNIDDLKILKAKRDDLLIQEYLNGDEYGIDVYVDLISKEIVSIFAKKKIKMRAGETDKAVSIIDYELFAMVEEFVYKLGLIGPADIDIFKVNDKYYISEVNPRFGGGYLLAYECGENYPLYIRNNLEGKVNKQNIGNYQEGIYMMKHDTVTIKGESDLI